MASVEVGGLSAVERGYVLAAVRARGRHAAELVAEHLPPGSSVGRAGELARAAAELASDPAARERESARLDATLPEGIERVHPSWWTRPPASTYPPARAYLERRATAHLVPMPPAPAVPPGAALTTLDALPGERLVALVSALGRRRLAIAFSGAPREALAQLCARLGEPAASSLVAELHRLQPSHDEVRAAQRALFQLAVDAPDAHSLFASAGARWLAATLATRGGDLLRRVAQRLPLPLGAALLGEAGAIAADPDGCAAAVAELLR